MLQSCELTLQVQMGMLQESELMSTNKASKRHKGTVLATPKREATQCALHTSNKCITILA